MEKVGSIPKQILLACLVSFPLLLIAIAVYQNSPADLLDKFVNGVRSTTTTTEGATVKKIDNTTAAAARSLVPPTTVPPPPSIGKPADINAAKTDEQLLNGLLTAGFDEKTCLSRYQSHLYRKQPSPHKPSDHLIAKLRAYESLHRKCGPGTEPYNQTIKRLQYSNPQQTHEQQVINTTTDCKYVIWLPANGLGNRMLSMVATFLYAILTDRVMLVEFGVDMTGLFCEPFLNSTWESPTSFSSRSTPNLNLPTYSNTLQKLINTNFTPMITTTLLPDTSTLLLLPPIIFLNLQHTREQNTANYFFHCDTTHHLLNKIPILVIRSDQYFVPSLFMTPSFQSELTQIFPFDNETIFHHLSRYLFHPTNTPWGLITRYYTTYLHTVDERIGLQIRVFAKSITPTNTIIQQILSCTLPNHILPETDTSTSTNRTTTTTTKAILVTSLHADYSNRLREIYWSNPTKTGEIVTVHQPTSDGVQKYGDGEQAVKALTEIFLLSLCDVLVTSGRSTFGYVAQGLAGLRPWVMYKTVGVKVKDPACVRDFSIEPCFHYPPNNQCSGGGVGRGVMEGFRKCEDARAGVKLVNAALG